MKKQPKKGGGGNMILLAGLGIGAALLFATKTKAQSKDSATSTPPDGPDDIPDAPKILAVNTSATESPVPTGVVSDEEGMEPTKTPAANTDGNATSQYSEINNDEDSGADSSYNGSNSSGNTTAIRKYKAPQNENVPPLITTALTPKEKAIIDKGVLSDDLAMQRPDLYKAIYIKKHGATGNGRKALQAADAAIRQIQTKNTTKVTAIQKKKRRLSIKRHPKTAAMVNAAKTHAKTTAHVIEKTATKHMAKPASKKARPLHHAPVKKRVVAQHKKTVHKKS